MPIARKVESTLARAARHLIAFVAGAALLMTPALAAPNMRDATFSSSADRPHAQASMFVGATYRIVIDRRTGQPRGRPSLKVAGMIKGPASSDIKLAQGLEISGARTGKPAVFISGRELGPIDRKANLSTGAAIAIGVGVVLVAAVAIALASAGCYDEDQKARCD